MAVTFSGLASGINSSSLISQLVAAAKQPATVLQSQQSDLASQKSIVDQLTSAVSSLGDFATGLSLDSDAQFRTATSSDSHVSVAVSGAATATAHDIRVQQTATSQIVTSRTFSSNSAGVLGTGGLTIQTGTGTPASVSWNATDTLDSIASKINNTQSGTSASVLFDGTNYQLVVSSQKTGTTNAATFTDSGDGLGLSNSANVRVAAQDAKLTIDGIAVTRPTNVIDDALSGVTLTLNSAPAASEPDTQVTVGNDTTAITNKLNTFVSDYNAIMQQINGQLTYTGQTAPTSSLFGDSTLRQLQDQLEAVGYSTFGSSSLSQLGITFDKTGIMSLDSTQLTTALNNDPNALGTLFVQGGLSQKLTDLSNAYTEPGDGILVAKSAGMTTQSNDLQTEIDQINANATALQTQLQAQFNALETTMSTLNSQSSTITKLFQTPVTGA